ncbi:MAG: hypothetical protein HFF79_03170 [Oscillospiraceae bacterium]|jgi:hypothetical protein|nr:hypothetical protein [Oscillospiraceae bacterium]
MENQVNPAAVPSAYDYRLYDRIWRRVSPELDPYPEVRAASAPSAARAETPHTIQVSPTAQNTQTARSAQAAQTTQAAAPAPAGGTVSAGGGLEGLPGADANPCCMGTQAQVSVGVLTGFIEEEAASRRHYLILARHTRSQQAAALLRTFAGEKQELVQRLRAAYFLITGANYTPAVMVEQLGCRPLPDMLRDVYHQEACDGYNYERAADEAADTCLTKLFEELSKASYSRAEQVLALLGKIIR